MHCPILDPKVNLTLLLQNPVWNDKHLETCQDLGLQNRPNLINIFEKIHNNAMLEESPKLAFLHMDRMLTSA